MSATTITPMHPAPRPGQRFAVIDADPDKVGDWGRDHWELLEADPTAADPYLPGWRTCGMFPSRRAANARAAELSSVAS